MKKHNSEIETPLPIYSDWIEKIKKLDEIEFPSERVVLFLAADFSKISSMKLVELAKLQIAKGVHYVCCWGPDCEVAHDCFDEANIILQLDENFERNVMSTWHANESLEEALWFCIFNAKPEDEFLETYSTFVVGIGETATRKALESLLDDIYGLNEMITNS